MQTPVHSKPATSSSLTPSAYSCIPLCSTGPQRVASCINCNMGIPHCAPIWQQASSQWMPWPPHWAHQSLASASLWTREGSFLLSGICDEPVWSRESTQLYHPVGWNHTFSNEIWSPVLGRGSLSQIYPSFGNLPRPSGTLQSSLCIFSLLLY